MFTENIKEVRKDQQIVLSTLPKLSGLLSPDASVHLDLTWGMSTLHECRMMCSCWDAMQQE